MISRITEADEIGKHVNFPIGIFVSADGCQVSAELDYLGWGVKHKWHLSGEEIISLVICCYLIQFLETNIIIMCIL
jgi:hypothetical protein